MMNPAVNKTRGAVIVTRVSGNEQAKEGTSLDSQRDACRAKAQALALPIIAEYEDAAVSGAFLQSRLGMQAALADIQAGRADTLITLNIDRYSRDREHQERIKKAVRAAGGRLVFCDADYADNAAGNLNFNIRGDFAVFEREHFRERSMGGKRAKLEAGNQVARMSPYGYHIPTKADILRGDYPPEQIGKYMTLPEQAAIVCWAFENYASGSHSLPELAQALNARGVPTAKGGLRWRASTFRSIFTNPVYKGEPVGGRWNSLKSEDHLGEIDKRTGRPRVGKHFKWEAPAENWVSLSAPAIVDGQTWDQVQERMRCNQSKRGGQPNRLRMLSGLLFCPGCGGTLNVQTPNTKAGMAGARIYRCGQRVRLRQDTGKVTCTARTYSAEWLEESTRTAILDACRRPEAIAAAITAWQRRENAQAVGNSPSKDPRRELTALDKALAEITADDMIAVQAQMAGMKAGASPDAYGAVFADLAARRKDLEDRRGRVAASMSRAPGTGAGRKRKSAAEIQSAALEAARAVLTSESVTPAQRRAVVGMLVDQVIPEMRQAVEVRFLPGTFGEEIRECRVSRDEDTLQQTFIFRVTWLLVGW